MPTYNEVVTQVQNLTKTEQLRLLEELKAIVESSIEVEGETELVSSGEIAASDTAWQDYVAGSDRGKPLQQVELELFGRELD